MDTSDGVAKIVRNLANPPLDKKIMEFVTVMCARRLTPDDNKGVGIMGGGEGSKEEQGLDRYCVLRYPPIAFGYNNIVRRTSSTNTVGASQPLATLGDLQRDEIGIAGYTEVLTNDLSYHHHNFTALGRTINPLIAVAFSNPANI